MEKYDIACPKCSSTISLSEVFRDFSNENPNSAECLDFNEFQRDFYINLPRNSAQWDMVKFSPVFRDSIIEPIQNYRWRCPNGHENYLKDSEYKMKPEFLRELELNQKKEEQRKLQKEEARLRKIKRKKEEEEIRKERIVKGVCELCGKKLNIFVRVFAVNKVHKKCIHFTK